MPSNQQNVLQVFIDEAGDTTFFGKGKQNIIGSNGVSKSFILGMVQIKTDFDTLRQKIVQKEKAIQNNPYYTGVPSVQKKIAKYGKFVFHAKDDIPEIRKEFYDFLREQDFSLQAIVGRKIMPLFINKHNSNGNEFYADLLSHLLKDKLHNSKIVLHIAERGSSTADVNLNQAVRKAYERVKKSRKHSQKNNVAEVVFNVQPYQREPLLSLADYALWTVQRIFEKGETRFYTYMIDKISLVVDLYDLNSLPTNKWRNYYTKTNLLTESNQIKMSPSNG